MIPIPSNRTKVCAEYVSAVAGLTRAVTAAAFPSIFPAPLLLHRDARQPITFDGLPHVITNTELPAPPGGSLEAARDISVITPVGEGSVRVGSEQGVGESQKAGRHLWGTIDSEAGVPGGLVVDAVLTSPPYPGVYDYLGHARYARSQLGALPRRSKALANASLGLDGCAENGSVSESVAERQSKTRGLDHRAIEGLSRGASIFVDSPVPTGRDWPSDWTDGEIGAKSDVRRRRRSAPPADQMPEYHPPGVDSVAKSDENRLLAKWAQDQKDWLVSTSGVLRAGGGRMAVMVGDGDGLDTRQSLMQEVEALGGAGGKGALRVVGWATLRAAEGARRSMRTEHLVLLEKA